MKKYSDIQELQLLVEDEETGHDLNSAGHFDPFNVRSIVMPALKLLSLSYLQQPVYLAKFIPIQSRKHSSRKVGMAKVVSIRRKNNNPLPISIHADFFPLRCHSITF